MCMMICVGLQKYRLNLKINISCLLQMITLEKSKIYFLKTKDNAFLKFKEHKNLVENCTNKIIKALRTNNGIEFSNSEFNMFCKSFFMLSHKIVKHTPQQNGMEERMNRTLLNKARDAC